MTEFYVLALVILAVLVLGGVIQTYLLRAWAKRTLPDEVEALRSTVADHGLRLGSLERDVRSIAKTLEGLPGRIAADVVNAILDLMNRQEEESGTSKVRAALSSVRAAREAAMGDEIEQAMAPAMKIESHNRNEGE